MTSLDRDGRSGFTLVELAVALLVTAVVGTAIVSLVDVSRKGARTVHSETAAGRALRAAAEQVARDLRQTSQPQLTITTLADQNHEITLRQPVSVTAGVVSWGVYDPVLGPDTAARTKPGWSLRYTVRTVLLDGGVVDRQLVRQILDTAGKVRHERPILRHLEQGFAADPGFRVEQSGVLWKVTISARTGTGGAGAPVRSLSFDVALRNQ